MRLLSSVNRGVLAFRFLRNRILAPVFTFAAVLLALSCGGGGGGDKPPTGPPPPTPVLTTVTVTLSASTLQVGQSASASASGTDQNGASIGVGTVTWSSSSSAVASISAAGAITAVAAGQTTITATAGSRSGQSTLTVIPVPVASVTVSPATASLLVGATQQLTAVTLDAANATLTGRTVTWSSSDATKASVSSSGLVTGVAAGSATITASSEGKSGTALVTVTSSTAEVCSSATALQLVVGDVVALTAAQKASLCLGAATASEYALIPFHNSTVAANVVPLTITGAGTTAAISPPAVSLQSALPGPLYGTRLRQSVQPPRESWEAEFRQRERRDLASASERVRGVKRGTASLTGIPASPVVGSVVQLNANGTGNLCTTAKQLHPARVVAVLPNTIVFVDTLAPSGGYTNAELAAFGAAFDTLGFALDTLYFGAPTDVDVNGRVAIFFTQGVNQIPQPQDGYVGGYFSARDLFAATPSGCLASNEGEIFYLPVPDPNSTINGNYKNKADLAAGVLATLVHEFQHLINSGRRLYVNNAAVSSEEVWLNEGLSHIAEELLYYRISGNSPSTNLGLSVVQSTQAQVDAINTYQIQNLGRLVTFMKAPETNSPYAASADLAARGAVWQFLRYAADRLGGSERSTWFPLVNSTTAGQANFNAVFGNINTMSRDWAVAQFMDDTGLGAASNFTNPSWNYRSLLPAINDGAWPLLTRSLTTNPVSVTLSGGGAAYLRFRVDAGVFATVAATSSGLAVPSSVDVMLVRTH